MITSCNAPRSPSLPRSDGSSIRRRDAQVDRSPHSSGTLFPRSTVRKGMRMPTCARSTPGSVPGVVSMATARPTSSAFVRADDWTRQPGDYGGRRHLDRHRRAQGEASRRRSAAQRTPIRTAARERGDQAGSAGRDARSGTGSHAGASRSFHLASDRRAARRDSRRTRAAVATGRSWHRCGRPRCSGHSRRPRRSPPDSECQALPDVRRIIRTILIARRRCQRRDQAPLTSNTLEV